MAGHGGNYETDSATWPELAEEPDKVSPHPLPRFATKAAPAAAGPSTSAHDGPASRTRSKTKAQA